MTQIEKVASKITVIIFEDYDNRYKIIIYDYNKNLIIVELILS